MTDVSFAMAAKSDQLNAVDLTGIEPVITITQVDVIKGSDQPVVIHYTGHEGQPWKPSKSMIRVISGCWGSDSNNWIGKQVKIYNDPTVTWAGQAVGGIRILAMSDIDQDKTFTITLNRKQRKPYQVKKLVQPMYPQDQFNAALPKMQQAIESRSMTVDQVIAHCSKTGKLSQEQLTAIQSLQTTSEGEF